MKPWLLMAALVVAAAPGGCPRGAAGGGSVNELERRVERIREGERVEGDVRVFLKDGKLSPEAAKVFAAALGKAPEEERERLVQGLAEVGRLGDPLHQPGVRLLRDAGAIAVLVEEGLKRAGTARDAALDALLEGVPPEILKPHGAALAADLKARPGTTALLVAAKAKAAAARPVVQALASREEAAEIARAALGDAAVEQRFIREFLEAREPERKAALAKTLGYVGTPAALKVLAGEMRTELAVEMPMISRRSVRVDIVAALSFAFPDKTFLWDNAVKNDEGYARIEAFCEQTFGVRWTKPRPRFLWVEGFPADFAPPEG